MTYSFVPSQDTLVMYLFIRIFAYNSCFQENDEEKAEAMKPENNNKQDEICANITEKTSSS